MNKAQVQNSRHGLQKNRPAARRRGDEPHVVGTGVDVGCDRDGHGGDIIGFGTSSYRSYSETERLHHRLPVFGKWSGLRSYQRRPPVVEALQHLEAWRNYTDVDLIVFTSRTPAQCAADARGRCQVPAIGAALADHMGCPVFWDFRSADVHWAERCARLAPFLVTTPCARLCGADAGRRPF